LVLLQAHAPRPTLESQSEHSSPCSASDPEPACGPAGGSWTFEEDSVFERGLAHSDEADPDRWAKIAGLLPGKSARQVSLRYQKLVADVLRVELGGVVVVHYS